jgi:hypothetical protein
MSRTDSSANDRAELAVNVAPVINDYKQAFFFRRWCSTIAGGARPCVNGSLPATVHCLQTFLFVFPPVLGIACSILLNVGIFASVWLAAAIGGGVFQTSFHFSLSCSLSLHITNTLTAFSRCCVRDELGGQVLQHPVPTTLIRRA